MPLWKTAGFWSKPEAHLDSRCHSCNLTLGHFPILLLPVRISGISMEPTYDDGTVNLVNRFSYYWKQPARGDVVAIRTSGSHIMFLKRIIGLPGETIAIEEGVVLINGKPLDEPYLLNRQPWDVFLPKIRK